MKKLIVLIGLVVLLTGCGTVTSKTAIKEFKDSVNNSKSYKLTGTMEINNDEEAFIYNLESYYLKDDYYKVILVNQTNNHEQIILKNNEDVYVITPELNKSFKFQSEWPENSSQAYLLSSILKDITNDKDVELQDNEKNFVLKSKVNYPNNEELIYQKVYFDKDMNIKKVEVYDKNDIVKIKVNFDKVDLKAGLSKDDFRIDEYIDKETNKTTEEEDCTGEACKTDEKKTNTEVDSNSNNQINNSEDSTTSETDTKMQSETQSQSQTQEQNQSQSQTQTQGQSQIQTDTKNQSNNSPANNTKTSQSSKYDLDKIIYPLYIPSDTFLTNSETVKTEKGDRNILTFTGEKNFVLIEEQAVMGSEMEVIPVYGDPLILSGAIGALSANSLTWDIDNVSYYLASTDLSTSEMLTIANSLGNNIMVSGEK